MPGRLTRLSAIGAGWKPNLCRPATESVGRNFGGRGSTPYERIHQLSAMFCTAAASTGVVSHFTRQDFVGDRLAKLWRLKAPFGLGLEETESPA